MESLPDEVLELIIGDTDAKSVAACRQVCRRWNVLSVRLLSKNVAATGFKTSAKIESFLRLTAKRIQNFPFSKLILQEIDRKNIKSLNNLFHTCSEHLREVDTGYVRIVSPTLTQAMRALTAQIAAAPRLQVLTTKFEGKYFTGSIFTSLRELHLHKIQLEEQLPPFASVPNLQILDIAYFVFTLNYKSTGMRGGCCNWPFPEDYKTVREIKLRTIELYIKFGEVSQEEILTTVLSEWANVKIANFKCYKVFRNKVPSTVNDLWLNRALKNVLALQATCVDSLSVVLFQRNFNRSEPTFTFNIPILPKLRKLELAFENSSPIEPINEISFPNLEHIQIKNFREPTSLLSSSAVFSHVKTLQLEENDEYTFWQMSSPTLPNFGEVFPNLQEFEYSFTTGYCKQPNLDVISHIFCSLRLTCLQKLKFHFIISDSHYTSDLGLAASRRIYEMFSGFDNLEKVAEDAKAVAKNNEESSYWEETEKVRLPSLVGCSGLNSLELSWPISEYFVQCVLLRMPPLQQLSVRLREVSEGTLEKLKALHGSEIKIKVE